MRFSLIERTMTMRLIWRLFLTLTRSLNFAVKLLYPVHLYILFAVTYISNRLFSCQAWMMLKACGSALDLLLTSWYVLALFCNVISAVAERDGDLEFEVCGCGNDLNIICNTEKLFV